MADFNKIRDDFPILARTVYGKPLIYFDNGATTHKPQAVTDAIIAVHNEYNANIHRAVHFLSDKASEAYENARKKVRSFINAEFTEEIIFTSGTTASINMLAWSFGEKFIGASDEIVVSELEHHANIVPWQMLCERKGAKLVVVPVDDNGEIIFEEYVRLLTERTRIVSMAHVSNALGTILPVKRIVEAAHERGIPVHLDGAQGIQHGITDVRETGCDFYSFSGHKIYGPTGIGVFYGRKSLLDEMPPWMGGGDMVDKVSFKGTTYNVLPFKFEAGTTNISGAIGLAAALDYLGSIGFDAIREREAMLLQKLTSELSSIPGIKDNWNS